MATNIIGREQEVKILSDLYNSKKAELVALYGRRGIGKTFLVKSLFMDKFDFFVTGKYQGTKKDELEVFHDSLLAYSKFPYTCPNNWKEAFEQLKHYIDTLNKDKVLVFIDEMPWLDTPKSKFVSEFESFWNNWASTQSKLFMIICGSATTWMNTHVIRQKGGLHRRCTRSIKLSQFTLHETELFLKRKKINWTRHQIAECYMIMGGTPYYLDLLQKGLSAPQNIDYLFFSKNAELRSEYSVLMDSLFMRSQLYRRVVSLLAKHSAGMTRHQITSSLNIGEGGTLSNVLENLIDCDFIRGYRSIGKVERDTMYQLTDMYVLFYLKFLNNSGGTDEHFWSNTIDMPARRVWSGYAFEQLCLNHISQIKESLGIRGILSNVYSWYQQSDTAKGILGGQIDMLIERRDHVINICEVKFSISPFMISKKYFEEMTTRMEIFRNATKTKSALHLTMIAASGLVNNEYADSIQNVITLDSLFEK